MLPKRRIANKEKLRASPWEDEASFHSLISEPYYIFRKAREYRSDLPASFKGIPAEIAVKDPFSCIFKHSCR